MAIAKASYHSHACRTCHLKYQDFCADVDGDGQCAGCKGQRVWQLLIDNAARIECCHSNARTCTKEDRKAYSLVGKHTWRQCAVCKRTWSLEWERAHG